jgi:sulfur carrier protein
MVQLNGESSSTTAQTVRELVAEYTGRSISANGSDTEGRRLGIAVAKNGAVVPRDLWHHEPVEHSDTFEIISATQGG